MPDYPRGPDRSSSLLKRYLTASDVGMSFPRAFRERVWKQLPRDHALVLLATMLAEADTDGQLAGPRRDVDKEWAARIEWWAAVDRRRQC